MGFATGAGSTVLGQGLSKPTSALNDSEKTYQVTNVLPFPLSRPLSRPRFLVPMDPAVEVNSPASSPLCVKALPSLSSNPANLGLSLCFCFFPTSLPLTLEFGALPVPTGASGGDGNDVGRSVAGRRCRSVKEDSRDSS